jgi:hypothetical protein
MVIRVKIGVVIEIEAKLLIIIITVVVLRLLFLPQKIKNGVPLLMREEGLHLPQKMEWGPSFNEGRSLPLPYQDRFPTEPRTRLYPISLRQPIQPGGRVQLPSIWQTVQMIQPMGPSAPQRIAIMDGTIITQRAMTGQIGYLPLENLFYSDIKDHAYNSAEI